MIGFQESLIYKKSFGKVFKIMVPTTNSYHSSNPLSKHLKKTTLQKIFQISH